MRSGNREGKHGIQVSITVVIVLSCLVTIFLVLMLGEMRARDLEPFVVGASLSTYIYEQGALPTDWSDFVEWAGKHGDVYSSNALSRRYILHSDFGAPGVTNIVDAVSPKFRERAKKLDDIVRFQYLHVMGLQ